MVSEFAANPPTAESAVGGRCESVEKGISQAEIEAKFLVEDSSQVRQLVDVLQSDELDVESVSAADIVDGYRDTPNWRLGRSG